MDLLTEVKKLKAFRNKINKLIRDPRMGKYTHTKVGLILTSLLYKHRIKGFDQLIKSYKKL